MVVGEIPNVVADSSAEDSVRDLDHQAFSDGRIYGTVCTVSHESREDLSDRDVLVLKAVARLMGSELELERDSLEVENSRLERRLAEVETELAEVREALQLAESSPSAGGDFVDSRGWRPG